MMLFVLDFLFLNFLLKTGLLGRLILQKSLTAGIGNTYFIICIKFGSYSICTVKIEYFQFNLSIHHLQGRYHVICHNYEIQIACMH